MSWAGEVTIDTSLPLQVASKAGTTCTLEWRHFTSATHIIPNAYEVERQHWSGSAWTSLTSFPGVGLVPLYVLGTEHVPVYQGRSLGAGGTFTKNADHILLQANAGAQANGVSAVFNDTYLTHHQEAFVVDYSLVRTSTTSTVNGYIQPVVRNPEQDILLDPILNAATSLTAGARGTRRVSIPSGHGTGNERVVRAQATIEANVGGNNALRIYRIYRLNVQDGPPKLTMTGLVAGRLYRARVRTLRGTDPTTGHFAPAPWGSGDSWSPYLEWVQ